MVTRLTSSAFGIWGMAEKNERLESWKQIASVLNREVRTVQMWEKHEGLPVHRHFHNRRSTVFAFRAEIEAWARGRTEIRLSGKPTESTRNFASPQRNRLAILLPATGPAEKALALLLRDAAQRLESV